MGGGRVGVTTGAYIRNVLDGKQFVVTTDDAMAIMADERGAYEVRQGEYALVASGTCAACLGRVNEGDPFVVKYHPTLPGGIFHQPCQPTGPGWYGVEDQGEGAEDL